MTRILKALLCALWLALPQAGAADLSGAVRMIDGDTLDVGSVRVRLHGIDAPERDQSCTSLRGETWACGLWAEAEAARRFDGRQARCTPQGRDRYDRVLARCMVGGEDMGRVLVRDGVAFAFRRYSMDYDLEEKGAAVRGNGLHASRVQRPADFRAAQRGEEPAPGTCAIKGNISSGGARIYHRPGQRDYAATRVSPAKGERWFCSAAEAEAAGWRAARR